MREIGSEFWDVPTTSIGNTLFPESIQWYLSGRSALQAIIKELHSAGTVSMPSWCCDSMVKPFIDAGMEVHFYPVYWRDGLIQEISLDSDVLFLMDYFGYTGHQPDMSGFSGIVIRDITHSIFSAEYSDADYYFGSLRKWCGVWTGGYGWARDGHSLIMENSDDHGYIPLREKAMQLKNSFIHGWGVNDKEYLKVFEYAEEALDCVGIAPATDRDVFLANEMDVERIRKQRRTNADILRKAFPDWLIFPNLSDNDTPMFVPILVPDGKRNNLRRYLIENDVYCPVHWPVSEYHKLNERTDFLYENELSLVCDQRYTEEDMGRMVEITKMFIGEA